MISFLGCVLGLWTAGCATSGVKPLELAADQSPAHLKIAAKNGDRDLVRYFNSSLTKNLEGNQLVKKEQEDIEFSVESVAENIMEPVALSTGSASPSKEMTFRVKTVAMDGKADLHDFGVPNLNEEFKLKLDERAQVLSAGSFERGTIFYVPPISLPSMPVQVGDTWPMTAEWVSTKTGIPLRIEVVSILKSFRKCGDGRCAEIEISGDVTIVGAPQNMLASRLGDQNLTMRFTSEISGKLLFHVERGALIYQYSKSRERLTGEAETVEVESCITAALAEPDQYSITQGQTYKCKPAAEMPVL